MDVRAIRSAADYKLALAQVSTPMEAYEDRRHAITPSGPVAA